jgi:DNA adenine methylase
MLLNQAIQKPPMKWVGNKQGTAVIDRVAQLYAPYRETHVWREPFVGIGGALFSIAPEKAICSDASAEVIGLHRWICDGGEPISFPYEWAESEFYERRERFRVLQFEYRDNLGFGDRDEFFSLMLWLNRACFNGLWQVNKSGLFNSPVGRKSNGSLNRFETPAMPIYQKGWDFFEGGFADKFTDGDRFVYADPPYWGTHSAYVSTGFAWNKQLRLATILAGAGMPCAASNSSAPEIIALYRGLGFTIELIPVRRSINCNGSDRPNAIEMLAHKNCI